MKTIKPVIALFLCTLCSVSLAQHEMHNMGGADANIVTTLPADNAVLANSPAAISLQFETEHTLVKLVLKNPESDIINIDFRFDPTPDSEFVHALPALDDSDYYAVEWAALTATGQLLRGTFHFSFGDNAMPPSHYLEQMEHRRHIMTPNYKLL